ncbi:AAA family ATPase [Bifidobacterium animalis]|uniref:AAA family ATPase n=1 Tax=Bifidobacterium animalis TaxID=28025 RepID=UPI001BCB6466
MNSEEIVLPRTAGEYEGDGIARTFGGLPYDPETGEVISKAEAVRRREEVAALGEQVPEYECWQRDSFMAEMRDDDVFMLEKPRITHLHAPEYVLRPLLPRKAVSIIAADSGTGKSTLAAHIEALASRGELSEGRPLKCLVVTTEDSQDDISAQYAAEGANVDNIRLLVVESGSRTAADGSPALKTFGPNDLKTIINVAFKVRPDIIRLDPLHRFASGDWNNGRSAEFIDELTVAAQSLNCAVLGIMHTRKGATNAKESITGTGQWVAKARSVMVMAAPDDDGNHVVLQQTKANRSATQNYEITFAVKPMMFDDGDEYDLRFVADMVETTRTADDVFQQNAADRAAYVDRDELNDLSGWVYDRLAERNGHMFASELYRLASERPERWSRGQVRRAFASAGVKQTKQAQRHPKSILYRVCKISG